MRGKGSCERLQRVASHGFGTTTGHLQRIQPRRPVGVARQRLGAGRVGKVGGADVRDAVGFDRTQPTQWTAHEAERWHQQRCSTGIHRLHQRMNQPVIMKPRQPDQAAGLAGIHRHRCRQCLALRQHGRMGQLDATRVGGGAGGVLKVGQGIGVCRRYPAPAGLGRHHREQLTGAVPGQLRQMLARPGHRLLVGEREHDLGVGRNAGEAIQSNTRLARIRRRRRDRHQTRHDAGPEGLDGRQPVAERQ